MKSGWKTSEFWITLIALALPVLVHLGVLTPDAAMGVEETSTSFFTELFDLIGVIVPTAYILGRTYLKSR